MKFSFPFFYKIPYNNIYSPFLFTPSPMNTFLLHPVHQCHLVSTVSTLSLSFSFTHSIGFPVSSVIYSTSTITFHNPRNIYNKFPCFSASPRPSAIPALFISSPSFLPFLVPQSISSMVMSTTSSMSSISFCSPRQAHKSFFAFPPVPVHQQ